MRFAAVNSVSVGFYSLKTFGGYVFDEIRFPTGTNPDYLRSGRFIERKRNLILFGNVGTDKIHRTTALRVEACQYRIPGPVFPNHRSGESVNPGQEKEESCSGF